MADREDPLVAFKFGLEIEGKLTGFFTSVGGIGSESEVVEHKIVNQRGKEVTMLIPGRLEYKDIYLELELDINMVMWDWLANVLANDPGFRKDGSIIDKIALLNAKDRISN